MGMGSSQHNQKRGKKYLKNKQKLRNKFFHILQHNQLKKNYQKKIRKIQKFHQIFLKTSGSSFQYVKLITFSFQVVISESFLFLANFIIKVKEEDSKLSNFSESDRDKIQIQQQKNQHFKLKVYKNKLVVQIEQELRIFNLTSNYLERMRLKTRKDPKQNMSEINKKLLGLQQLRVVFVLFTQTPSLFNGSHSSNLEPFDLFVQYIVLDESTANLNMKTDDFIQNMLKQQLKDCTNITVGHKLNTIVDYDKILYIENGNVLEFDEPSNLLAQFLNSINIDKQLTFPNLY